MKDISLQNILDNTDLYANNKCGLTHGLLDSSWNTASLGPTVHNAFFSTNMSKGGIDLRAYDNEFGRSVGEPSYCNIVKFFGDFKGSCEGNIRVEDFPFIEANLLRKLIARFGSVGNIGLTVGLDVENREGVCGVLFAFR